MMFPHQMVYEVPSDLTNEDIDVILEPLEEFQPEPSEFEGRLVEGSDEIPEPFEINLEMLREIAEENDLLD